MIRSDDIPGAGHGGCRRGRGGSSVSGDGGGCMRAGSGGRRRGRVGLADRLLKLVGLADDNMRMYIGPRTERLPWVSRNRHTPGFYMTSNSGHMRIRELATSKVQPPAKARVLRR